MKRLGIATVALARGAMLEGAPEEAESWAREACPFLEVLSVYQILARACLSSALLSRQRLREAREEAEKAVGMLERMGGAGASAVSVWLLFAEVCQTQGDDAAAEGALRKAIERLRLTAEDLPDAAARERFLRQVPAMERVLDLARERSLGVELPSAR